MNLPIDDKELDVIIGQLWKSRKNAGEPLVEPLYQKLLSIQKEKF